MITHATFPPLFALLQQIAFALGVLGIVVGVAALVLPKRLLVGVLAVVLAIVPPALGLGACRLRLQTTDAANVGQPPGTAAKNRGFGYALAYADARRGGYGGIAPLLLGAIAIFRARSRARTGPVAIVLATGATCSALVVAATTPPKEITKATAHLVDARALYAVHRDEGCHQLRVTIEDDVGWDGKAWPRRVAPEIRAAIPDYDAVANRCIRWAIAGTNFFDPALAESPFLLDDASKAEVEALPRIFRVPQGELFEPAIQGPRPYVKFEVAARTESGPTDFPPALIDNVMNRRVDRIAACRTGGPGTVTIQLTIAVEGRATLVTSVSADVDPAVAACVVGAIEGLDFPPPDGPVTITFPILLADWTPRGP